MTKMALANRASGVQLQSHSALRVEFAELARQNPDFLNLTGVVTDIPVPPWVVEAMDRSLADDSVTSAPTAGLASLREAIAARYARDGGPEYDPAGEVLVACSPTHSLSLVALALIEPGDEVIVTRPGYNFDQFVVLAGGKPVFVDLDGRSGYQLPLDKLAGAVSPRTKMIAMASPHNPTGRVYTREELRGVAEIAQRHNLFVLSDEVFYGLAFDGRSHTPTASLEGMRERTVAVDGVTKSLLMPGIRIGWVLGPSWLISAMTTLLRWNLQYVPVVAQRAAEALVASPIEWVRDIQREMQSRRDALTAGLANSKHLRATPPEGTFFYFPDVSGAGLPSTEMARVVASEGLVGAAPGSGYHGEGHLRISLAAPAHRLREAGARIAQIYDGLHGGVEGTASTE